MCITDPPPVPAAAVKELPVKLAIGHVLDAVLIQWDGPSLYLRLSAAQARAVGSRLMRAADESDATMKGREQ